MSEPKIDRRDLLMAAGAAAGGLLLSGCGEGDPYSLVKPAVPGDPGTGTWEEKTVSSVCGQCPAGCGIRVRVVEGRAIKIEGNVEYPVNRGGLGPKGQSGLDVLYHPDRIRGPLRRKGPRGSGGWEPVSWEGAIGEISTHLKKVREEGRAQGVIVLDGERRGLVPDLWSRFLEAYGSPNHLDHRSATYGGKVLATRYMHGVTDLPAYDWKSTRYVLGFGASLFESWCQTIQLMQASSLLRRGMPGLRVKFVQICPRYSLTAANSDEWVPIEPGTYGALALSIGHVLVKKGLYDKEFIRDHTFGFDEWKDEAGVTHAGYRQMIESFPPEKVAAITGVSAKTIERIAREMFENKPAIAVADGGAASATNGLGTAMSIHALNALLGNLERPGGMLVQHPAPLQAWPAVEADDAARTGRTAPRIDGIGGPVCALGLGFVQNLPVALASGKPYPPEALFLYRSNPVFSKPDGGRWKEALGKIPLVVSFTPLPDETMRYADFILPDHTYLERWEITDPIPSSGTPLVGFRQPVVAPLYDTKPTADVVIQLARALGGSVAEAFPWEGSRPAVEERLKGLLGVESGFPAAETPAELRKGMQASSGWWSTTPYAFERWEEAFPTPSGRFEFFSQEIARRLKEAGMSVTDELCLPHWEPPKFSGSPEDFPFVLVAYRGMDYTEGGVRHLALLRELPLTRRAAWKQRVELHPKDAVRLHLKDGQRIRVESTAGSCEAWVQIYAGTRPGTLGWPLGHGPWPPAPDGSGGSAALLVNQSDPLAGIFALQGTRVRIAKGGHS